MTTSTPSATDRFTALHERFVLRNPIAVLLVSAVLVGLSAWQAKDFTLDASADALTLERDESLSYYRMTRARYGSDDYLIVTFNPQGDLFDDVSLQHLSNLRADLEGLDGVDSVISILDVPLIKSPPVDLKNIEQGLRRLEQRETDRSLARHELVNSILYRDLIISGDARTTALRLNLKQDKKYIELRKSRDQLRRQEYNASLSSEEMQVLDFVTSEFDVLNRQVLAREQETISRVREIMQTYKNVATLHLGGVPMIVADSIDFIRHDLIAFGLAVIAFLIVILLVAFRQPRWAILSLLNCASVCIVMLGILGVSNWYVTVVSSNFVSLLLILCLALTIHIIVRYREMQARNPEAEQLILVRETVRHIVVPCLYTALTTMVAFGSLVVSGIRPVIDFGWMMMLGIAIGFVFSFVLFPAGLMLFQPGKSRDLHDVTASITSFFSHMIDGRVWQALLITGVLVAVGVAGITQLTVENRFIDYYKKSTEIYQGMELIDRALGGTTPLDVIIDAPVIDEPEVVANSSALTENEVDDEFAELFMDESDEEAGITATSYWFNYPRLAEVGKIHDYLDSLPETGKVISVATTGRLLGQLDESVLRDNVLLSVVYKRMPEDVKAALITPYMSDDGDQIRFSVRIFESDKTLRRNELIQKIRTDLRERFGLADEQIHLSGMLVLYNNMLQSLFQSQMLTLGAVFVVILGMFIALFRSLRLAVTAIIPNLVSAVLVLGFMGWMSIPLDLMTITIAAITVGIAVDDTIHYTHRFTREFCVDRDYWATVHRCHKTVGRAMYYTSITIMLGFSILALSQFIPTIYFGLLTGFAMLVALLANMTLLPVLLVTFRVCDCSDD